MIGNRIEKLHVHMFPFIIFPGLNMTQTFTIRPSRADTGSNVHVHVSEMIFTYVHTYVHTYILIQCTYLHVYTHALHAILG